MNCIALEAERRIYMDDVEGEWKRVLEGREDC